MTTLIKSHTGAMVPARAGMHYSICIDGYGQAYQSVLDESDVLDGYVAVPLADFWKTFKLEKCTMLHAPLSDGDEIECLFNDGQWRSVPHRYGDDQLDYVQNKNGHIRHADPNLRDAPGFINTQPEER